MAMEILWASAKEVQGAAVAKTLWVSAAETLGAAEVEALGATVAASLRGGGGLVCCRGDNSDGRLGCGGGDDDGGGGLGSGDGGLGKRLGCGGDDSDGLRSASQMRRIRPVPDVGQRLQCKWFDRKSGHLLEEGKNIIFDTQDGPELDEYDIGLIWMMKAGKRGGEISKLMSYDVAFNVGRANCTVTKASFSSDAFYPQGGDLRQGTMANHGAGPSKHIVVESSNISE
uniref:Uncharacterized protein n=1 Tax=Oryza punctata TaxID=4537 RepID=A0A0E0JKB8_ORYPU